MSGLEDESDLRGGADGWDEGPAGVILSSEAFPEEIIAGYRSFFGFWFGGLSMVPVTPSGFPVAKRTMTVPFLGGSRRYGFN